MAAPLAPSKHSSGAPPTHGAKSLSPSDSLAIPQRDGASPAHTKFASPAHTAFFIYLTHLRTQDSPQLRTHRLHSSLNTPCYLKLSCAHKIRLTCAHTQIESRSLFACFLLGWDGGVGGGGAGGVLITSLWTFIYMMISFCSLLPQYHVTQMLCV